MITIAGLASALRPDHTELRVRGDSEVVCIAGIIGHVRRDLTVHLALSRLSRAARDAFAALADAYVIDAGADNRPFIARLPANPTERAALRTALGLRPKETIR